MSHDVDIKINNRAYGKEVLDMCRTYENRIPSRGVYLKKVRKQIKEAEN